MEPAILLAEAEEALLKQDPAMFDTTPDAFAECIEYVRAVGDEEAWRAAYPSLEAFYELHEARHPDIRYYARASREIATADALTAPGGLPSERLRRYRESEES
jgi:hypothetical protein